MFIFVYGDGKIVAVIVEHSNLYPSPHFYCMTANKHKSGVKNLLKCIYIYRILDDLLYEMLLYMCMK